MKYKTSEMSINSQKKILIVDDDIIYLNMTKMYFESKEFQVDFAINGSLALRMLPNSNYNLVIIDYQLPSLNGLELLEILKRNNYTDKVNIVMLTGERNEEIVKKALQLGAKSVFDKNKLHENVYDKIAFYLE